MKNGNEPGACTADLRTLVLRLASSDPDMDEHGWCWSCDGASWEDDATGFDVYIHNPGCLLVDARMALGLEVPWFIGECKHEVAP